MPSNHPKADITYKESFHTYTFAKNFAIGASVGLFNSVLVTPIANYTNHVLNSLSYADNKTTVATKFTCARAFDGFFPYNVSAVLRVGTSIAINHVFLNQLKNQGLADNDGAIFSAAMVAGAIAGATASLPEAIAQTQQLTVEKPTALQVIKTAYQHNGFFGLTRGMGAIMLRSSGFSIGFLRLLPEVSRQLRQEIGHAGLADFLSTVICGFVVTGLTVPLQVLRFKKQENFMAKGAAPTYPAIIADAYKSPKGLTSLWQGANPRLLFVSISMATLWKGAEALNHEISLLEKESHRPTR